MDTQNNPALEQSSDNLKISQRTIDRILRVIGAIMIQSTKDLTLKITQDGGLEFKTLLPQLQTVVKIYPEGPFYLTSTESGDDSEKEIYLTQEEEEMVIQCLFIKGIEKHKEKA